LDPIIHNIDPFLVRFGDGFGIRWYSLPYMLGMLFTWLSLRNAARQRAIPNLTEEDSESFVLLAILAALVGARFFHVFVFEFDRYGFDPAAWIAVWRGGLAFHGGLLGIVLAVWWFAQRHGLRVYDLTDRIAVPVALALALGRIANFINAEMYGTPYDGPFCVDYSQNEYMAFPPEGCRHPTQLYESAKNFGIAGALLLARERIRPRPGVLTWAFIGSYGWIRFTLMYVREERTVWMGLTLSQVFSALMGLLGLVMLAWVLSRPPVPPPAPTERRSEAHPPRRDPRKSRRGTRGGGRPGT
jgi:phosphatidylglycerol---prolipoprotein diacylglyceryl transferase